MGFKEDLDNKTEETLAIIESYLPKEEGFQKTVIEAMNYSFLAGGKRLRPLIMHEVFKAYGGSGDMIYPFMAALEMIHNYSLVHDDLPEMDNDELRRGMPTTHVKYGAGMAVLAGDGLLNYAFETAAKAFDYAKSIDEYKMGARALKVLSKKAGIYGMIGGQCLDVQADNHELSLDIDGVMFIDANKTAALLECAFMVGAILAGANDEEVDRMEKVGYNVGVAFQLQDDLLDMTSTTEVLGKPVGSDERNGKETFITLRGMEECDKEQRRMSQEAIGLLDGAAGDMAFVRALVESLISRKM